MMNAQRGEGWMVRRTEDDRSGRTAAAAEVGRAAAG